MMIIIVITIIIIHYSQHSSRGIGIDHQHALTVYGLLSMMVRVALSEEYKHLKQNSSCPRFNWDCY